MSDTPTKAVYLLSDLHLGAPDPRRSFVREKQVVQWLQSIESDASAIYLLGDVFDFWFEYRYAVPRGYVRFLGQLARMSDMGIEIHVFTGNHDLWYQTYLEEQLGASIYREPVVRELNGQTFYLAHGDGLGPGDHGYKFMKRVVTHPLARWLFGRLHPNFGIGLAYWFSHNGGDHNYHAGPPDMAYVCTEQDPLLRHTLDLLRERSDIDHFVYGHRHKYVDHALGSHRRMFILGDWIQYFSYLRVDFHGPQLCQWPIHARHGANVKEERIK